MRHALWRAAQWIVAPGCGAKIRRHVREQMKPLGNGRWLDVGCGPRSRVASALPGMLIGVDISAERLRATRRSGVVAVRASAIALPFKTASFDGVICLGLLHHLNPADAEVALLEMRRVVQPGGVVLLHDNVRPRSALRRPLSAVLRALDRGRYIRDEAALRLMLQRHDFTVGRRMTYSWTGLEACWATLLCPADRVDATACG